MAVAIPHTSESDTYLLQQIAGALVQATGQEIGHERLYKSKDETELMSVWAGAVVNPDTMEQILVPVGGGDPPVGGGNATVGGGGFSLLRRFAGWFRAFRDTVIRVMDY